jgi:hypothetical protein
MSSKSIFDALNKYGQEGVQALSQATPQDTGKTAGSWTYEIEKTPTSYAIIWSNTNVVNGVPIAILLQVGHATATGGYVAGRDYINPALRPVFDRMAADVWKEVTAV